MGMQSPLTAQALGRSPYEDVVDGDGEDANRQPTQQYDHRGRPVNANTRRINRDIIRSHNEVMLVIGVAESDNSSTKPAIDSQREHDAYEDSLGRSLDTAAKRCIELVGVFGIHGLRQRILIYRRYSEIPFSTLFQNARRDFSFSRDLLPGAPASLLTEYIDRCVLRLWPEDQGRTMTRQIIQEVWSYTSAHLKLFVSLQRLGLISSRQWLPHWTFFIPFMRDSPIGPMPPLQGFDPQSLLGWCGNALVASTPFLAWVMVLRLARDMEQYLWTKVYKKLPNTVFRGRRLTPPASSEPVVSAQPVPAVVELPPIQENSFLEQEVSHDELLAEDVQSPELARSESLPAVRARRASIFSAREDDDATDEEDDEAVSATLISFDVEATESTDAPPGLWSAELRPSVAQDPRTLAMTQPVYLDTILTQLPSLLATNIFTTSVVRVLMVPYEATALRLVAHSFVIRRELTCADMFDVHFIDGITVTSIINLMGTELLSLALSGEIWAVFTALSQWFHLSEEEWRAADNETQVESR